MKIIALVAVTTFLFMVTEASAQSRAGIRCKNGGYRGSVWCCNVNSAVCMRRASAAASSSR
jgi:hypothetical protein